MPQKIYAIYVKINKSMIIINNVENVNGKLNMQRINVLNVIDQKQHNGIIRNCSKNLIQYAKSVEKS